MKMNNYLLASILTIIITINGCTQENEIDNLSDSLNYQSCCGVEPVEQTFETGQYLYTPNVFTPNGDGINDKWMPYFSSGQDKIMAVFIYSLADSTLIHQMYEYNIYEEGKYGWDGLKSKNNSNTGDYSLHKGGFYFEIFFSEPVKFKNDEIKYTGQGCSIVCDEDAIIFKDKDGCFYPIQVNEVSKLDRSLSNGEDNCFGN